MFQSETKIVPKRIHCAHSTLLHYYMLFAPQKSMIYDSPVLFPKAISLQEIKQDGFTTTTLLKSGRITSVKSPFEVWLYTQSFSLQVYAVDEQNLFVRNFWYDGTGPDAYFWVGNTRRPTPKGWVVPHPPMDILYSDLQSVNPGKNILKMCKKCNDAASGNMQKLNLALQ